MDKLDLTGLGGDPSTLDDLEFMQNGLADAIKGLASFFTDYDANAIIISGMFNYVSGLNTIWQDGYVAYLGEIYFVSGGTFLTADTLAIDFSQTFDSNGTQTFEDFTVNQTYIVRRGVLKVSAALPGELEMTYVSLAIRKFLSIGLVNNLSTNWVVITYLNSFSADPANPTSLPWYRKNKIGNIELEGSCYHAALTSSIVFTLPAGFRPARRKRFISTAYINSILSSTVVNITTAGVVSINGNYIPGDEISFSFDGMSFSTD